MRWLLSLLVLALGGTAWAEQGAERYTLRYKFQPGEELRWNVVHRNQIRTSVSGSTQLAETTSQSIKVWRVREVKPDGSAVFEHLVEDIDMRHQLSGRNEVRYNSRTDKEPPRGFDNVACAVGVPLSVITLDPVGKIVHREKKQVKGSPQSEGEITVPMPDGPIAVGESWTRPSDVSAKGQDGRLATIKLLQRFTLEEVKTGVARIRMATHVLTPIRDPAVEAQVVQCAPSGEVRFDIAAGRIRSQRSDVDRSVVGFRGEASSIHYATRFSEEFLAATPVEQVAGD
jgi:hypothetical protein